MRSASAPRARGVVARTAWLCAFGVVSRAQLISDLIVPPTDCYTSELVGYDFKVEPRDSGISLHWSVSPSVSPFETVSFKAVSSDPDVGWLSIGFSSDGNMIGSDAVVGSLEAELVLEYHLGSKTLPVQLSPTVDESISLFAEQDITGGALDRVGNNTSLSFTRPTYEEENASGRQALFSNSSDALIMLWAAGSAETFGYHFLGRGAFSVDLLCAEPATRIEEGEEEEEGQPFQPTAAGSAPLLTEAPSVSPDILLFSVSPTAAPISPFPPRSADGGGPTSGGSPRLPAARGCFVQAVGLGLSSIGVSIVASGMV